MPSLTIHETDTSGTPTATFVVTSTPSPSTTSGSTLTSRVDVLPPSIHSSTSSASRSLPSSTLIARLLTPFLPTGYPHSVSPDYTPYQLYDSLQAFASTIAGLLASRAVLIGLGVGSESGSATSAMLLSIAQESIGRGATIFFAHRFAVRIEAEVKYYRFLADIVNDAAFVLDCLSPSLSTWARVPALCAASGCRAICGVCGGSSKAILSAHFARNGNIGELNAKDGSQETVVSLVGMWVGGLVVSMVNSEMATWTWLLGLLGCHLWANYMAVRSVRLRTLNRGRATTVMGRLLDGIDEVDWEIVGAQEEVFSRGDQFRLGSQAIGRCSLGDMRQFLVCMGGKANKATKAYSNLHSPLDRLAQTFEKENYLLWMEASTSQCVIVLKESASSETQLQAWCHGIRLARRMSRGSGKEATDDSTIHLVEQTLRQNLAEWKELRKKILEGGWDLSASNLETAAGRRVRAQIE